MSTRAMRVTYAFVLGRPRGRPVGLVMRGIPFCEGLYLYDVIQDKGQGKAGQEINVGQEYAYRWRKGFTAQSIWSGFLDTAMSSFSTQRALCTKRAVLVGFSGC